MSAPADTDNSARPRPGTFSSLRTRNFRLFATGQLVSNTGSWIQRIAQDWLVISLTGSATAVGITTALQFLPTLLFGLLGGLIADRYTKRRILQLTQVGMAAMAAVLAYLTLSHQVQAWHVFLIALALGTVIAVDNPTRQSFVNEMVGPDQLRNAISLNSSIFQLGGLIGPAISGVLIGAVGAGCSFAINAISYVAPLVALSRLRPDELTVLPSAARTGTRLRDGLAYALHRPGIFWPTLLAGVFGLFTVNLPVTLTAYAKHVFNAGAGGYGLLSSVVALGSMTGALISARRHSTIRLRAIAEIAFLLAATYIVAALVVDEALYAVLLVAVGACTLLFLTSVNAAVQLAADDAVRGRVMGLYLLVFIGSGALGGPVLGSVDQYLGPRTGMLLSGILPALATVLVALRLARLRHLRLRLRPSLTGLVTVVPR